MQQVQDADLVHLAVDAMNERGNVAAQVQQGVEQTEMPKNHSPPSTHDTLM